MLVAQRLQNLMWMVAPLPESRLNQQKLIGLFICRLPLTRLVARFNPKVRLTREVFFKAS